MKKNLVLLFALTLVVLGALYVTQSRRLAGQKQQLAALRDELEHQTRRAQELQSANQWLKKQRRDSVDQSDTDPTAADQTPETPATTPPAFAPAGTPAAVESGKPNQDSGAMGKLIAKMMQDPDTRKFIRDQQRQMMDSLYGPLIRQMGLAPEEAQTLKDFIADTQIKGAEHASSLFGVNSTNRTDVLNALTAAQAESDEQIKTFLGEERYAQYQDYQQTLGERMQLNQFKLQTAGDPSPLTEAQVEQLLAIMREEKQALAAAMGQPPPGPGQDQANWQAFLSDDQMQKLLESQGTVNQRVIERAGSVLSADQWESFGRFQTNQLQMMRAGLSMARKFLAPESAQGGTTEPNQ